MTSGNIPGPDDFVRQLVAGLNAVEHVPDEVLGEVVTRDGACMSLDRQTHEPDWSADDLTDREIAARTCAGCPVQRECLELELRTSGDATLGVWGALPAEDVRDLHSVWRARRRGDRAAEGGEQA